MNELFNTQLIDNSKNTETQNIEVPIYYYSF